MRLATIVTSEGLRLHVRGSDGYVDVAHATADASLVSLAAVLAGGALALERIRAVSDQSGREVSKSEFAVAVPCTNRILCLGLNYEEHAREGGRERTSWPELFVRGRDSLLAPFGDLVKPALSPRFDYEGELGVVIGSGGRYIRAANAIAAVAGYVVLNDASAREWQRAASQWTAGKNFDGSMPIGPELVTAEEVDVSDVALTTRLNGEVMQSARTSQMIFGIPETIEHISSFTTLRPGDVIATGTPSGVGFARRPPVWLEPGDTVEVEIEGVGRIANRVVAETGVSGDWPWTPAAPAER